MHQDKSRLNSDVCMCCTLVLTCSVGDRYTLHYGESRPSHCYKICMSVVLCCYNMPTGVCLPHAGSRCMDHIETCRHMPLHLIIYVQR